MDTAGEGDGRIERVALLYVNRASGDLLCDRRGSLVVQRLKASACNVGDLGSIPGLGRSPGEGNGNPLQCSCLENPMDGGAWWATVHGSQRVGHD